MEGGRRGRRVAVPGYIKVKRLGNGSQAEVFEMVRRHDGDDNGDEAERFAVKVYHGELSQQSLQTELRLLTAVQGHGNILRIVEHIDSDPNLRALVLELCETDLHKLHSQSGVSQSDIVHITRGVLSGLEHIHQHKIVHRDVKPENIAIVADGSARLIDFGVAVSVDDADGMKKRRGSLEYLAPEIFNKDSYGVPVDMFAFGVTCYYVLGNQHPLAIPGITYAKAAAQSRRYSLSFGSNFSHVDKDSIDLISWLMHPSDTWRPDASFALTCPPYASSPQGASDHLVLSFELQSPALPQQPRDLDRASLLQTVKESDSRCNLPDPDLSVVDALYIVGASEAEDTQVQKLCKLERAIYSAQLVDEAHATSLFHQNVRRKLLDQARKSCAMDFPCRMAPASIMH